MLKVKDLFDDYICPFTKLCTYPEYEKVHKIMRDDVQKKDYTLELHSEMRTIYENLDTVDFRKWHQEKMYYFKDTLGDCFDYYQRVHHMFIAIIYYLKYHIKRDKKIHYEYSQATSRFLNEMIVQNSN